MAKRIFDTGFNELTENKITFVIAYETKKGKVRERTVTTTYDRFKKNYGMIPGKSKKPGKEGKRRYAKKIKVEREGKVKKVARVKRSDLFYNPEKRVYTKREAQELTRIKTERGYIFQTQEDVEKYWNYDRTTKRFERVGGIETREAAPGDIKLFHQIVSLVTYQFIDDDGNQYKENTTYKGFSNVQKKDTSFNKDDLEQQAINRTKPAFLADGGKYDKIESAIVNVESIVQVYDPGEWNG